MIDLLVELIAPLTVILTLLLIVHAPLLEQSGAKSVYFLWLAVPASLLIYMLPLDWFKDASVINGQIEHFIVNSTEVIRSSLNINWLALVWFVVSVFFISYWLVNHIQQMGKLNLRPYQLDDTDLVLPESLSIYQSAHTGSPMLVGLFKQKLIIPEDFATLYNEEQQRLVLEHEICHFDRNDIYWNFMAFMFLALFWFHPLVWLAYFRFRRDQELSCDQTVLAQKHLNSRINYSKALLVTAESAQPMAFAQLTFKKYGDKEIMFERIKHIKTNAKASKLGLAMVSMLSSTVLSSMSYAGSLGSEAKFAEGTNYQAKPVTRVEPEYPFAAVQQEMSGAVLLKFDIKPNGRPDNITVLKSKPEGVFDNVAMTALSHWQYEEHGYEVIAGNVVQLDFLFDQNAERVNLIEAIKVSN
jgi:TonB family protein